MPDLGTCPMCGAPISRGEHNPDAKPPYTPRIMWICERGHRVVEPDRNR